MNEEKLGTQYPTLLKVLPQSVSIHDSLAQTFIGVRNCRLAVGLCVHDGEVLYFIEPTNAPAAPEGGAPKLIFPQEKIEFGKDGTFRSCAVRCMMEELGVSERLLRFHSQELHRFENHLPLDRTGGIPTTKCIVYFAAQVPKGVRFRPNPAEVRSIVKVGSGDLIDVAYSGRKPTSKSICYAHVLKAMCTANLLPGDVRWREIVDILFQEKQPAAVH